METAIVRKMAKMENSPIAPIDIPFCKVDFHNGTGKVFQNPFTIEQRYVKKANILYMSFIFSTSVVKSEFDKLTNALKPAGYEFLSVSSYSNKLDITYTIDNIF